MNYHGDGHPNSEPFNQQTNPSELSTELIHFSDHPIKLQYLNIFTTMAISPNMSLTGSTLNNDEVFRSQEYEALRIRKAL